MINNEIKLIATDNTANYLSLNNQSKFSNLSNFVVKQIKRTTEDFYQKYYTFRLVDKLDSYYLRAKLLPFGANQINIESIEIRSYYDMKILKLPSNSTLTKLEFKKYLERFPIIQNDCDHLEEKEEEVQQSDSFTSKESESQKLEEDLEIESAEEENFSNQSDEQSANNGSVRVQDVVFYFSDEMRLNINGIRGEDHKISLNVLEKSLALEADFIKKLDEITSEKLSHYYKVINENESRILNIVIRQTSRNHKEGSKDKSCTLITAYYLEPSLVYNRWKKEIKKTKKSCQNWLDNLTIIYDC